MDRYQKVEKPRAETPIDENEIRITSQGRMRNYITYAMTLLQAPFYLFFHYHNLPCLFNFTCLLSSFSLQHLRFAVVRTILISFFSQIILFASSQEKGSNEIVFKAMGRAINKTVTIVELIKRRIVGLHQNTQIGSTDITDTWEPLEEGLLPLETTRHVSMITITLSKKEINTSSVGYQPPLPADQVKASADFDYEGESSPNGRIRGRGGRGRGRARGNGFISADYEDGGWDRNMGNPRGGRGRGRGRGRGFRGRGRGGYNGPQLDMQQDGGYNQDVPPQGRGCGGMWTMFIAVVAVAGVVIVEGVVALDPMGQSRQLLEAADWPPSVHRS
ncbi:hypothetical protein Ahy_A06g026196 isoform B [Arachis hypogaea]|uniref:DNA/RNA-binding protein Alba-like domain-containing protein n=1 Tax=Arachis hypogaea TaxID=3818 RepID=A0A445CJN1_ARAHY|nr:hypothetical protein Ahy_A06g026196 isoform B [Arachis hypogaea]